MKIFYNSNVIDSVFFLRYSLVRHVLNCLMASQNRGIKLTRACYSQIYFNLPVS